MVNKEEVLDAAVIATAVAVAVEAMAAQMVLKVLAVTTAAALGATATEAQVEVVEAQEAEEQVPRAAMAVVAEAVEATVFLPMVVPVAPAVLAWNGTPRTDPAVEEGREGRPVLHSRQVAMVIPADSMAAVEVGLVMHHLQVPAAVAGRASS
jgi:hypothetical protein